MYNTFYELPLQQESQKRGCHYGSHENWGNCGHRNKSCKKTRQRLWKPRKLRQQKPPQHEAQQEPIQPPPRGGDEVSVGVSWRDKHCDFRNTDILHNNITTTTTIAVQGEGVGDVDGSESKRK